MGSNNRPRFSFYVEDITERKQAEEALSQSEARFRTVVETSGEGIAIARPNGPFFYINQRMADLLGYAVDEIIGKSALDFCDADWKQQVLQIRQELQQGKILQGEFKFRRKDGSVFWSQYNASPMYNDQGEQIATFAMHTDVTKRKQMEADLQASQAELLATNERLNQVLESISDTFYAVDANWRLTYLNHHAEMAWHRSRHELLGTVLWDMFPNYGETQGYREHAAAMQERTPRQAEFYSPNLKTWVEVNLYPTPDGGLAVYFRDITQRKQTEAALRENEQRQAFLLNLSDLLRPLSEPLAIEETITRTTLDFFQADRCYYNVIEGDRAIISRDAVRGELTSVAGVYDLNTLPIFKAMVDAGRPFVVQDAHTTDLLDENLRQLCIQLQVISFLDVPVIKDGQPVGLLVVTQTTPREWTDFDADLTVEIAERTWAAVERARAEAAQQQSEEKYRSLFHSIDEGFSIIEVLFDENERPIDYRFLEVNAMFEAQTGIQNAVGRRMREIAPEHEEHWFEIYGQVAKNGEAVRFENPAEQLHRYYDVYAFRVGQPEEHKVAVLFKDISAQKRAEETLRKSEERQAFLLKLSDALRPLADPLEIQAAATQILGEHLGVARAVYIEIDGDEYVIARDYVNGIPSMVGRYPVSSFGPGKLADYRAGKTRVVRDTREDIHNSPSDHANFTTINVGAGIGVPLVKDGAFVANLVVHMNEPRN